MITYLRVNFLLNGEIIAKRAIISSIILSFIPLFALINLIINIIKNKNIKNIDKST